MFTKVLIANRGEIAIRIMTTCREMGIATVAVYSEADQAARHVREADEAYEIGPAPATQSYLRGEKIIAAAQESGAQAIHPGYGFLSENASFVEACEAANLVFIGPSAAAMRLMGSKITAKQLAQSVDAPTIPGYNGEHQDDKRLLQQAYKIGFPLLIKASAGGGGKGMREVHAEKDFLTELAGARREALASFGDATVFLEQLLLHPRHIEIQILGDHYGHLISLGERECSIQRRHQKIIEEAPSVALTPALRSKMGATAVRIAQAASYVNAGTLEFMLDENEHFYFLEMNTRLQVEHPVTELVTGLDLVRHQLLIAAGEPLTLRQEELQPRGHAIEARLYAEDPERQFIPSTGILAQFRPPTGPGIRIDSGVVAGDEITQYYDPMLAKLIVYGENRAAAIARMQNVLSQTIVLGVTTNISLLQTIIQHPAYDAGKTTTSFLDEYDLLNPTNASTGEEYLKLALQAAALLELTGPGTSHSRPGDHNPWHTLGTWRGNSESRSTSYMYKEKRYPVTITAISVQTNTWQVYIDEQAGEPVTLAIGPEQQIFLSQAHHQIRIHAQFLEHEILLSVHGQIFRLERLRPPDVDHIAHTDNNERRQQSLTAPMAGTIVKVQTGEGEEVVQHQILVILTAMKMEHSITAPYAGKIRHIHCQEGDVVKGGAVLVEME